MPGVAKLTTPAAQGAGLGPGRLGVGMFGTRRGRGIAWRLVEAVLQFLNLGEQRTDDGLRFRRLASDQFFRDLQRHALHVGEKQTCGQTDSQKTSSRAVADYWLIVIRVAGQLRSHSALAPKLQPRWVDRISIGSPVGPSNSALASKPIRTTSSAEFALSYTACMAPRAYP